MRIDKYLSDSNFGTRSEVKKLLSAKRVTVNGAVVKSPKIHVQIDDVICVDQQQVMYQMYQYIMMNKPGGVLSATKDGKTKTVIDILAAEDRFSGLFPVGRLDKDTTGFILLTNDGELAHAMLHPKKHVTKRYTAKLETPLDEAACHMFERGIILADGTVCLPAKLILGEVTSGVQTVSIVIEEGKFHQIKRMIAACGSHVLELHRDEIGPLQLDPILSVGEYRFLTQKEIQILLEGSHLDGRF